MRGWHEGRGDEMDEAGYAARGAEVLDVSPCLRERPSGAACMAWVQPSGKAVGWRSGRTATEGRGGCERPLQGAAVAGGFQAEAGKAAPWAGANSAGRRRGASLMTFHPRRPRMGAPRPCLPDGASENRDVPIFHCILPASENHSSSPPEAVLRKNPFSVHKGPRPAACGLLYLFPLLLRGPAPRPERTLPYPNTASSSMSPVVMGCCHGSFPPAGHHPSSMTILYTESYIHSYIRDLLHPMDINGIRWISVAARSGPVH